MIQVISDSIIVVVKLSVHGLLSEIVYVNLSALAHSQCGLFEITSFFVCDFCDEYDSHFGPKFTAALFCHRLFRNFKSLSH